MDGKKRKQRYYKFVPCVRYVNGLRIYFKNTQTIQVSQNGVVLNITRWDNVERGNYSQCWKPVCEKLKKLNTIKSLWEVAYIAKNYDLTTYCPRDGEDELPPGIKVLPSKYKRKEKNDTG